MRQLEKTTPNYSLLDLAKYLLKLGTTGFGGPVALVSYIQRDLLKIKNGLVNQITKRVWHFRN